MKAFRYLRPRDTAEALAALAATPGAPLHAGGVDLLDRMKERVDAPDAVIGLGDVRDASEIRVEEDGGVVLGALATLSDLAASPIVARFLPALAEAAGGAASLQIRNRATLGGNLAQGTRCGYWRHASFPCLLRGAERCPVREPGGVQETAGVFANDPCASAHPSSVAPVLGAYGAEIEVRSAAGERSLSFEDLWRAPRRGSAAFTALEPGEMIVRARVPARARPLRAGHHEVRQRAAFDWPLVSCAAVLEMEEDRVRAAAIWLGSVAPTPRRALAAEEALAGKPLDDASIRAAARAATEGATPLPGNVTKVRLVELATARALEAARRRA
jgi:xanthine dehydrogenase YagS FAD-binding subunit